MNDSIAYACICLAVPHRDELRTASLDLDKRRVQEVLLARA